MISYTYPEIVDYFGRKIQLDWVEDLTLNGEEIPSRTEAKLLMSAPDANNNSLKHIIKASAEANQLVLGDGSGAAAEAGKLVLGDGTSAEATAEQLVLGNGNGATATANQLVLGNGNGATAIAGQATGGDGNPVATWKLLYASNSGSYTVAVDSTNQASIKKGTLIAITYLNQLVSKKQTAVGSFTDAAGSSYSLYLPTQSDITVVPDPSDLERTYLLLEHMDISVNYTQNQITGSSAVRAIELDLENKSYEDSNTSNPLKIYSVWVLTDLPIITQTS